MDFEFQCRFHKFIPLKIYDKDLVIPNLYNGHLLGPGAIVVQNNLDVPLTDLSIVVKKCSNPSIKPIISLNSTLVNPGDLTQIPFTLSFAQGEGLTTPTESFHVVINLISIQHKIGTGSILRFFTGNSSAPLLYSYVDTDQSIQGAFVTVPQESCAKITDLPVILITSAGGVPTATLAKYYYPEFQAWMVYPVNRSPVPFEVAPLSESSALKAVDGLTELAEIFKINCGVNRNRILAVGSHHYGGKLAWALANHHPDRVIGVSPDSGWIYHAIPKFEEYVNPWLHTLIGWHSENSDPILSVSNFRNIPVLAGLGRGDGAGYPFRVYYLQQLFQDWKIEVYGEKDELPGYSSNPHTALKPTSSVLDFIAETLQKNRNLAPSFRVSCTNPSQFSSYGGLHIVSVENPLLPSYIDVIRKDTSWLLTTKNVLQFEFSST